MLSTFKTEDSREQGFTLVELLVVIIIIGILSAIAIPVFLNQRKKGVDASVKSDIKNAALIAETIAVDFPSATSFDVDTGSGHTTRTAFRDRGFKASPNNTIAIQGSPAGGYCVSGYNANGSADWLTTGGFFYDSSKGGLLSSTPMSLPYAGLCVWGPTYHQIGN